MPVVTASGIDFHSRSPKKRVDHINADLRKLKEEKTINNSQKSKMKLTKLKSIAVEPICFFSESITSTMSAKTKLKREIGN